MKRFAIVLFCCAVTALVASVAWFVRGVKAEVWKSNQHMHIRWNVTWLSDQYDRIERIGDANLRNDYITNFLHNACTLLNLEFTRCPNTSNLVERYYFDWNDRIDEAEHAARKVSSPSQSVELKNGSAFTLEAMPELLTAKVLPKVPVRFSLEENPTTGYQWEIEYNKSECVVKTEWREPRRDLMGAPGHRVVEVTSLVQTPVRVEFRYARSFEKEKPPAKSMRLLVYTAEGESDSAN